MARMGLFASFLTAVGDDSQGRNILCEAQENGTKWLFLRFKVAVRAYTCNCAESTETWNLPSTIWR
jgi:hypothetical protein